MNLLVLRQMCLNKRYAFIHLRHVMVFVMIEGAVGYFLYSVARKVTVQALQLPVKGEMGKQKMY